MLSSSEIRQQFIDYFTARHAHRFVPSSPVVPHEDPTLLFTNAGMNQFKEIFLGQSRTNEYTRAANTQKCIRAGGKHNDLEDVGKDTYHHTFFEMLGNWSFGDYFKRDAIAWAWDLLTNVWGLDKTRLHATVFGGDEAEGLDADREAAELWEEVTDINPDNIHFCGKKDNFWEMGDTGPCGPCSEIHIDLTPDKSGRNLVNADDPRVIEIWNLVFIQFNRDVSGSLAPLPAKHVDTGMGFERITAVLQGKGSNYDTDVFAPIFAAIRQVTGAKPYMGLLDDSPQGKVDMAYRVIADHIRTLTFALTDGAMPGNDGRGYVLRRILRRAVRMGYQTLQLREPFLYKLVDCVVQSMGEAFPELKKNPQGVADIIREEEESFNKTIARGIALFENAAGSVSDSVGRGRPRVISAEDAFKLHDTYGFPLDLTQVMAEERGLSVDVVGFNKLMEVAREKARASGGKESIAPALNDLVQNETLPATEFHGYDRDRLDGVTRRWLYEVNSGGYKKLDKARVGQQVVLILERTPFYAEAGGQVSDIGTIETREGAKLRITNMVKVGDIYFHIGEVEAGELAASTDNDIPLRMRVDCDRRARIMANHTATHLLNRALRLHVNPEADQKGSLVDDEKLRFDFAHSHALTAEQIEQVEQTVNRDIASDLPVYYDYAPQEKARGINGLRAVFGEKYPPNVRIVSIGASVEDLLNDPQNAQWADYSIEFCGGTHLPRTGDAEGFVITSQDAVSKGVRRLTAITGQAAHKAQAEADALLRRVEALHDAPVENLSGQVDTISQSIVEGQLPLLARQKIQDGLADLLHRLKEHNKAQSGELEDRVIESARAIADSAEDNLIVAQIPDADGKTLRTAMDVIKKKKPDAALLLAACVEDKLAFIAAVPQAMIEKGLKAGDWVREVAMAADGSGGGRPDMAQAGAKNPEKLHDALETAKNYAKEKM